MNKFMKMAVEEAKKGIHSGHGETVMNIRLELLKPQDEE